jgi:hypothetical protein
MRLRHWQASRKEVRDERVGSVRVGADVVGLDGHVCATVGAENVLVCPGVCGFGGSSGFRRDVSCRDVEVVRCLRWVHGLLAVNLEKECAYAKCVVCG